MSIERLTRTRDLSTKGEKGMYKGQKTRAGARSWIEDVRGRSISFEMDRYLARRIEISRDRSKLIRECFEGREGVRDMFRVLWELDAELLRVVTELEACGGRINLPLSEILTVLSHCMDIDERRNRRMSKDEW